MLSIANHENIIIVNGKKCYNAIQYTAQSVLSVTFDQELNNNMFSFLLLQMINQYKPIALLYNIEKQIPTKRQKKCAKHI